MDVTYLGVYNNGNAVADNNDKDEIIIIIRLLTYYKRKDWICFYFAVRQSHSQTPIDTRMSLIKYLFFIKDSRGHFTVN